VLEEGLEARFARHLRNHELLRAGLEALGFAFVVAPEYRLPMLNAVRLPPGLDDAAGRRKLLDEYDVEVGGGLGDFAGKIWRVGLMGEIARTVLAGGGRVVGMIPKALVRKEIVYEDLTELHVVDSMHERKAMMAERSDGFIAMPGGYGTFEEFCEVLTWSQLGFHHKPVALLNVAGYYDGLLALFDHAVAEAFVRPLHRSLVIAESEPLTLLDRLAAYQPPTVEKWITSPDAV